MGVAYRPLFTDSFAIQPLVIRYPEIQCCIEVDECHDGVERAQERCRPGIGLGEVRRDLHVVQRRERVVEECAALSCEPCTELVDPTVPERGQAAGHACDQIDGDVE